MRLSTILAAAAVAFFVYAAAHQIEPRAVLDALVDGVTSAVSQLHFG